MDQKKKYLPSSSKRKQFFIKNGSLLQEKLIGTFGPRYELPIRCFTAKELLKATDKFSNLIYPDVDSDGSLEIFGGLLGERSIIVAKVNDEIGSLYGIKEMICNIVMTSQLSHLKHVLKLVGCCLEFGRPVLVYENVRFQLLREFLYGPDKVEFLTWRSRVKIAKDIAYTISYLHNAFPTPIIYGFLSTRSIVIDEFGIPKLFDFSLAIRLPPGETKVQICRWHGESGFIDPNIWGSLYITPKNDVYSIGILLLVLITGKKAADTTSVQAADTTSVHEMIYISDYIKTKIAGGHLEEIVDCKIWESEEGDGKQQQLEDLIKLALRCIQNEDEERPDMIDVVKELCRIERI